MLPANAAGELQLGTKRPQMLSVTDFSSFYPISAPKRSWAGCSCTLQHPWHLTAATTAPHSRQRPPSKAALGGGGSTQPQVPPGTPSESRAGFFSSQKHQKAAARFNSWSLFPDPLYQRQAFGHATKEQARWPLGVTGTPGPSRWQRVPPQR